MLYALLPTLGRVDAVVTDPPYGIGFGYASYQDTRDNLADLIRSVMGPRIEPGARVCVTPGRPRADASQLAKFRKAGVLV